ncbi:MAG: Dabb family protein [Deltaproteobacteria bacterium]|nr:MAG: Dabb family protein [Deltaproteobacteria bacterium]
MVVRVVLIKLHDEFVPQREAIAAESERMLSAVPGVQAVEADIPADIQSAGSWDLCLRLRFADMDAVDAYVPHPAHREYLDWLEPRCHVKKAWNFTTRG